MTLIITVATRNFVIQIADTRLSSIDGKLFDDRLIKTTIVHCIDAKLCISYTGIAYIDNLRTDLWLTKILYNFKSWEKGFPVVTKFIHEKLNKALLNNKALQKYGITIVIAGLGINGTMRDVAISSISNTQQYIKKENGGYFQDIVTNKDKFDIKFFNAGKNFKYYIEIAGAVGKLKLKGLIKKLQKNLFNAKSLEDYKKIMDELVILLKNHRRTEGFENIIGEDCTGVLIDDNYKSYSTFYTKKTIVKRIPNIVSAKFTGTNLVMKYNK